MRAPRARHARVALRGRCIVTPNVSLVRAGGALLIAAALGPGMTAAQPRAEVAQAVSRPVEEILVVGRRYKRHAAGPVLEVEADELRSRPATDLGLVLESAFPALRAKRRGGVNLDPVLHGGSRDQINVTVDGAQVWGAGPFRMDPPTSLVPALDLGSVVLIPGPYLLSAGPPAWQVRSTSPPAFRNLRRVLTSADRLALRAPPTPTAAP